MRIVAGTHNTLWFGEMALGTIVRFRLTGRANAYSIPSYQPNVHALTALPDGRVWFADYQSDIVGRVQAKRTRARFTLYDTPNEAGGTQDMVAADDGSVWFTTSQNGIGHVLRSATHLARRWDRSEAARAAFQAAHRFLQQNHRHMHYARYRRQGLPIGSGVTEAACKTVFGQRLKRSGMRWHKPSGQVIVDLRVLRLSGIWEATLQRHVEFSSRPESLPQASPQRFTRRILKKAA